MLVIEAYSQRGYGKANNYFVPYWTIGKDTLYMFSEVRQKSQLTCRYSNF